MNDAEQFFSDAAGYIRRGQAMLAAGRETELVSLDKEAATLAERAGRMHAELKAKHGERFAELINELEAFAREMQQRRTATAAQLKGLKQFHRASIAYATADNSDKEG